MKYVSLVLAAIAVSVSATVDVKFFLYNSVNSVGPEELFLNTASLHFNSSYPTRFVIHGWNNNGLSEVNTDITTAYLAQGDFNVIVVDWSDCSETIDYASARACVPEVGDKVADMIIDLGLEPTEVTVVGHSLGAHVAGFTGKAIQAMGESLGVIVGLDPAYLGYLIIGPETRLNSNDALYVMTIHTSTLGFYSPIGTGNFFPNWSLSQPGCSGDINCDHGRAYKLFATSLNPANEFVSTQCRKFTDITSRNCVQSGPDRLMGGEPVDTDAIGVFYVETGSVYPYAL